jgi:hypothetical protein
MSPVLVLTLLQPQADQKPADSAALHPRYDE